MDERIAQNDAGRLADLMSTGGVVPSAGGGGDTRADDPAASAAPGVEIAGYALVRELSHGGQAVVYQAVQRATGRKVAVKVLREGPLASPRERARLDREVAALAAVDHPNVVAVVDVGSSRVDLQACKLEYSIVSPK